jgi:hypothetical protein
MKVLLTESQIRLIILENKKVKPGSPEELVELLDLLPVDEAAKYLSEEIFEELKKYYSDDIRPVDKTFTYYPQEECLKPYELEINFRPSNNTSQLGYCDETYVEVKYLNKESSNYRNNPFKSPTNLYSDLYHIIKHECSHFYLRQRNVEECLYHTHPDGMKKYYQDRQELVLHSREIFDRFEKNYPNWRRGTLESVVKRLKDDVKNLPNHTSIYFPFGAGLQKKYLTHIVNTYIKPNLNKDI